MKTVQCFILTALTLTASCISHNAGEPAREYVKEGNAVPEFTVAGSGGAVFRSPEDFAGKTTLLVFFATWCPQCRAELPEVDKVWEAFKEEDRYSVVAVSRGGASGKYEQSEDILQEYWNANGLSMPWYLDGDRDVFDKFASADIPRMYIVDGSGTVVWKSVSPEMKAADYIGLLKEY